MLTVVQKGIFFLRVKPDRTQARAAWRLAWSNAPSRRCACLTRWHETSVRSGARRAQGSHVGPSIEARERSAHGARSRARPPQKVRGRLISSSRYTDDARRMPRPTHKVAAWQGIFLRVGRYAVLCAARSCLRRPSATIRGNVMATH